MEGGSEAAAGEGAEEERALIDGAGGEGRGGGGGEAEAGEEGGGGGLGEEGGAAEEGSFGEVDEALQAGLAGAVGGGEVDAAEGVAHFEAEGMAGAEAAGLGAVFGEFAPPEGGFFGIAEEFEAVFAGVAGAGDGAEAAAEGVEFGEAVAVGEFGVGAGDELIDGGGAGALDGEGGAGGGEVFEGDAGGGVGLEAGEDSGGGVADEEVGVGAAAVEEEEVEDAAGVREEEGVLGLADGEAGDVVGEEAIEPEGGVGSLDEELAQVGDVEEAAVVADGEVFFGEALVVKGEEPSGEGREVGAGLEVDFVEGGAGGSRGVGHLGKVVAEAGLSIWMRIFGVVGGAGMRLPGRGGGRGWGMSEPVLLVEKVRRLFGETVAVSDLSFAVGKGEVVGLLGANGAGKTTAISIILGLMTPSSGRVRLFGMDPFKHRIAVLRRTNYASAYADLPSNLYVWQNLKVFAGIYRVKQADRKIDELLEMLEISHLKKRVTGHLSAGESTRLHLCKALLNDPELLMLDEPTASLDPDIADKVRKLLRRVQQERGLSILYTSHNMRDIEEVCDRVLFMHQGTIVAQGSPAEVIAKFDETTMENVFIRIVRGGDVEPAAG